MIQAVLILMSLALSYVAMTGLSMAMPRHYAQVYSNRLSDGKIRLLRIVASVVLVLSYMPMLKVWGAGTGFALWLLGILSIAAVVLLLLLAYRPRFSVHLALFLLALSIVAYAMLWLQY